MTRAAILAILALVALALLLARRSDAIADRGIAHGAEYDRFAFAQAHRDMKLEPMYRRGL